ncbi:MAG: AAA family ATPase [Bacteroidia bacterium]|nr:AAA family ATPase [Bacteroidia bacterium]
MDEQLRYFLENTAVVGADLESRLMHPFTKLKYPARQAFGALKNYAADFFQFGSEPRFVSLAGLRGVGKTTLLWQTASHTLSTHQGAVYFFNVNTLRNLGIDLHTALDEFQKQILKKRFKQLTEPITLLFDEVHDDDNWSKTLKILYDEARTAFILCTGSSALLLNSTADLSRRMHTLSLFPFSFSELLQAQNALSPQQEVLTPDATLGAELKEILFFGERAEQVHANLLGLTARISPVFAQEKIDMDLVISRYIDFLNFPNLLFFKDEVIISNSILDLFKRIIHEDIPKLKPTFNDFNKIERLILRLAGSDEINPEKLAGIIGVKQNEILELIGILAKAELLTVLLPYGGLDTKIVKNRKAFFMSPSLRRALLSSLYGQKLPEQFNSKLLEDTVVMYLKRVLREGAISFVSGNNDVNPDLVIETRDNPILLEIGTGKTTMRQIIQSKINHRYGILISNAIKEPELKGNIIQLPLNWFLLL